MKFGCIFKLIAIIVVILGTSFYLYEKYGKDFISENTEKAKELAINKIDKLVEDFKTREIENPLKDKFTEMLKDVEKRKNEFSDAKFEEIISSFNKIIKENNLNSKSLENLKKIVELKK
ncbi:MAG: hypothetical protein KKF62_08245 [Bacteroidetes bacterium]|nr:hypothetical protein [Bacteroidota bacterium]MBU1115091.1 hypothetical protein [Bacteroidota bacterium]MBU1796758.1 hypothetical protein [Bacteroidota bacterium]